MITVEKLLHDLSGEREPLSEAQKNAVVSGVTSDSRKIGAGTVFVAVKGTAQDGHAFIGEARSKGAVLILGEQPQEPGAVPYVQVPDSRAALAVLASAFHDHPSRGLKLVGVTGTSGKTTTTYLLESILTAAGEKVGVIGTVNFRFGSKVYPSTHTTPGAPELQALLAEMKADGCTAVVMEVSSHALSQHRVGAIAFDGMVFTNLTPEHLDFHADMEDYFQAKAMLFTGAAKYALSSGKRPYAAVNADDAYGRRLGKELLSGRTPGLAFSYFGLEDDVEVNGKGLRVTLDGISGRIGAVEIRSALAGAFNASNILGAVAVALGLGLSPEAIARGVRDLACVPGRLERVPNSRGVHALVDYAHKPDALEKVLKSLQEVRGNQRLITVFGCGGDRDRTKRPVMGRIAVTHSSHVFVTSDNPRTENPNAIIEEILKGMKDATNLTVEPDRRKAIHAAIAQAGSGDIVLIAGKGHEDYQIIGTEKIHFDDREIAAEALR
jgi:UDP-N-acetylmuramoyl-L-alanyl-D-glutamate--2,6-diaminopimelate ligase